MPTAIAVAIATAICLWTISKIVALLSSPPNAIPKAHFSVSVSRFWLLWIRGTGKEFSTCLAAHRRLGPVIRIGPREISINCIEDGVRTVYGGNWDKASMYDIFNNYGHQPLFAVRHAKPHAERKRLFTHVYTKSTLTVSARLKELLDMIIQDRLVPRLQEVAKTAASTEVFSLTREYSMDVVTAYIFGIENGTDWVGNPKEASKSLSAFQRALEPWGFFASTELPQLVGMLDRIGVSLVSPSVFSAFDAVQSFVLDLTTRAINSLSPADDCANASTGIIGDVWGRLGSLPDERKTRLIASDMVDQIHAGHEATGIVLTYLMWELSRNPETQDRLRDEIRSSNDAADSELLHAVLMETVRLYPAGFGPFPRVAPPNARVGGYSIPAETIVSASPFMLGRDSNIFPNPDAWLPERWTKANGEQQRQMKQRVWMFTSGNRICIGEHLAMLAMKAFVANVYRSYKTIITTTTTDMRQLETFFSIPADASLLLRFEAA